MNDVVAFAKRHVLPTVAVCLAILSCFFVTPNAGYIDYIDFKTIVCIFCIQASVAAMDSCHIFARVGARICSVFKTQRSVVCILVLITLAGAMFITNDMALLTFLPLSYLVLHKSGADVKTIIWCFILQNAAAVLGGMILPFGNPHNLYLYNLHSIPTLEFIATMAPTFIASVVMIFALVFITVKPLPLAETYQDEEINDEATGFIRAQKPVYVVLFVLTLAAALGFVSYWMVLLIVIIGIAAFNAKLFVQLDYGLLVTFLAFFIFAGNVSNIDFVREFLTDILEQNPLVAIVCACQVMSNLPATLMFAPFTSNWPVLLVATDIAGMGTPIASLASLITIRMFSTYCPESNAPFMKRFLGVGFSFLIILTCVAAVTLP